MTNDSLIDDGLTTGEPQASRRRAPTGALVAQSGRMSRTLTMVVVSMTMEEEKALMVRKRRSRVGGTKAPPPRFRILLRAPRRAVLSPSHRQVRVMRATVSLFRKKALPLVQRATRPSRG